MIAPPHRAYLSLGSNIAPRENLPRAVALLRESLPVQATSRVWETLAVGSAGPNFLNAAVLVYTDLAPEELKDRVLRPIEAHLGRVRVADKNAPRPIDLDIVIYDARVLDSELWRHAHLAVPLAELFPTIRHPKTGERLVDIARRLAESVWLEPRPEVAL